MINVPELATEPCDHCGESGEIAKGSEAFRCNVCRGTGSMLTEDGEAA